MPHFARELLELFIRWIHVVAGIMWVGNSMLFNWLDRNLRPRGTGLPGTPSSPAPTGASDPLSSTTPAPTGASNPLSSTTPAPTGASLIDGELWMVHSGGFYEVVKQQLAPGQLPEPLHWFKWQSYSTWMSGVALLVVVYYLGGAAYMVDPGVRDLGLGAAVAIGLGTLVGGFAVYDLLWRGPLKRSGKWGAALGYALVVGVAYALTHLLAGRAAYMHVGALLGTLMAGNVFFHIIPSQRELVAATAAGRPQDLALAKRAKQRSIHNNYLTFPVIFLMVGNHFPSTYGHPMSWLVLAVLIAGGAGVRHWLNVRFTTPTWRWALPMTAGATVAALVVLLSWPAAPGSGGTTASAPVRFADAHAVIAARCLACHSQHPTDPAFPTAPKGVTFDTPAQIARMAPLIRARAVDTTMMPLGNKTGMTPAERALLGRWLDEGAPLK